MGTGGRPALPSHSWLPLVTSINRWALLGQEKSPPSSFPITHRTHSDLGLKQFSYTLNCNVPQYYIVSFLPTRTNILLVISSNHHYKYPSKWQHTPATMPTTLPQPRLFPSPCQTKPLPITTPPPVSRSRRQSTMTPNHLAIHHPAALTLSAVAAVIVPPLPAAEAGDPTMKSTMSAVEDMEPVPVAELRPILSRC